MFQREKQERKERQEGNERQETNREKNNKEKDKAQYNIQSRTKELQHHWEKTG